MKLPIPVKVCGPWRPGKASAWVCACVPYRMKGRGQNPFILRFRLKNQASLARFREESYNEKQVLST